MAKEEITLKEAAALTGYHPDYIGALLREGKIPGRKIGRTWITSKDAVEAYAIHEEPALFSLKSLIFSVLCALIVVVVLAILINIAMVKNQPSENLDPLDVRQNKGITL